MPAFFAHKAFPVLLLLSLSQSGCAAPLGAKCKRNSDCKSWSCPKKYYEDYGRCRRKPPPKKAENKPTRPIRFWNSDEDKIHYCVSFTRRYLGKDVAYDKPLKYTVKIFMDDVCKEYGKPKCDEKMEYEVTHKGRICPTVLRQANISVSVPNVHIPRWRTGPAISPESQCANFAPALKAQCIRRHRTKQCSEKCHSIRDLHERDSCFRGCR